MSAAEHRALYAQWEVIWVVPGPRIIAQDFESDFVGALELYLKAKRADKKLCTLRCKNVGFPPPEKWRDIEPIYAKRKGKMIVVDEVLAEPPTWNRKMRYFNSNGVWWCPYCMQLRRFEKRRWAEIDGEPYSSDPAYYCPICDISHRDAYVIKYNPQAKSIMYAKRSRGGSKSKKKGKKKRGRRR